MLGQFPVSLLPLPRWLSLVFRPCRNNPYLYYSNIHLHLVPLWRMQSLIVGSILLLDPFSQQLLYIPLQVVICYFLGHPLLWIYIPRRRPSTWYAYPSASKNLLHALAYLQEL